MKVQKLSYKKTDSAVTSQLRPWHFLADLADFDFALCERHLS